MCYNEWPGTHSVSFEPGLNLVWDHIAVSIQWQCYASSPKTKHRVHIGFLMCWFGSPWPQGFQCIMEASSNHVLATSSRNKTYQHQMYATIMTNQDSSHRHMNRCRETYTLQHPIQAQPSVTIMETIRSLQASIVMQSTIHALWTSSIYFHHMLKNDLLFWHGSKLTLMWMAALNLDSPCHCNAHWHCPLPKFQFCVWSMS